MDNLVGIEGIPFITRFKTVNSIIDNNSCIHSIEGIPFITRFKTSLERISPSFGRLLSIEGIPFITRFKTYRK